jgi:hypothetical protein
MSLLLKALLSMAVAVAAAVAMATLASALADVAGGVVVLCAILVFTRTIMDFAAEPDEKPQRSGRAR